MRFALPRFALGATVAIMMSAPAWSAGGLLDGIKDQAASQLGGSQTSQTQSGGLSALGGAAGLGGTGGLASSLGLPSIGSGTASNAAGVLQYCVKNNYLGASGAEKVKEQLLDKVGLSQPEAEKDTGYQQGLGGLLQGSDGSSFSLENIKSNVKEKACDYVLENASSLI